MSVASSAGLAHPNQIIGKSDRDMPWAETHAELYRQGDCEVLDGIPKHNVIETQLKADGKLASIKLSKVALLDKNGQKIGVIGNYMEISSVEYTGQYQFGKNNLSLTKKQADCLLHLIRGMSFKQIGMEMGLSSRTVQHHLEAIRHKLNCDSKTALIKKALTFDFIKNRLFEK